MSSGFNSTEVAAADVNAYEICMNACIMQISSTGSNQINVGNGTYTTSDVLPECDNTNYSPGQIVAMSAGATIVFMFLVRFWGRCVLKILLRKDDHEIQEEKAYTDWVVQETARNAVIAEAIIHHKETHGEFEEGELELEEAKHQWEHELAEWKALAETQKLDIDRLSGLNDTLVDKLDRLNHELTFLHGPEGFKRLDARNASKELPSSEGDPTTHRHKNKKGTAWHKDPTGLHKLETYLERTQGVAGEDAISSDGSGSDVDAVAAGDPSAWTAALGIQQADTTIDVSGVLIGFHNRIKELSPVMPTPPPSDRGTWL